MALTPEEKKEVLLLIRKELRKHQPRTYTRCAEDAIEQARQQAESYSRGGVYTYETKPTEE